MAAPTTPTIVIDDEEPRSSHKRANAFVEKGNNNMSTVLYCTILYYTVLYCAVLRYTILQLSLYYLL